MVVALVIGPLRAVDGGHSGHVNPGASRAIFNSRLGIARFCSLIWLFLRRPSEPSGLSVTGSKQRKVLTKGNSRIDLQIRA
jgi:hypothetical protein